MDPVATTMLAKTMISAGGKAADLGKVFLNQLAEEESRVRLFFTNIFRKPVSWLFTLGFAPIIVCGVLFRGVKNIHNVGTVERIRLLILTFSLGLATFIAWLAATIFGTIAGFWITKQIFGIITAVGFLLGTSLSMTILILTQILLFNIVCHLFLSLSKPWVIEKVMEENGLKESNQRLQSDQHPVANS